MITSAQNPKIKWLRNLQRSSRERREAGVFVAEGVRLLEEALAAGWQAQALYCTEELDERAQRLVDGFVAVGALHELVTPAVLAAASDTETPQGLLAVLHFKELPFPPFLDFAFIPDQMRDPGNLGTMLRTAAAAGVGAVLLPPDGVDPFSPKVLRSGMGAHFHLPLLQLDWEQIAGLVERHALRVYLAEAGAGQEYTQADFRLPLALVIGGEAEGAGPQARRLAAERVYIPMPGGSESLNAAVAAGILLFEVLRQRSAA
jgi:RNA methyltransferase, TrmH family